MDDETRYAVMGTTLTPAHKRDLELSRSLRMKPAWLRVWREGRDVTDEDPETWPWLWPPRNELLAVPGSRSVRVDPTSLGPWKKMSGRDDAYTRRAGR